MNGIGNILTTKLQWGHGSYAVEIPAGPPALAMSSLQWGHGSYAVEIRSLILAVDHYNPASMGPRLECRGT